VEIYEVVDGSTTTIERTVRTTITVPAWASAEQIAEAMEILDPGSDLDGWRGVLPGWGATTIYSVPKT
jgi:hypothetical protein